MTDKQEVTKIFRELRQEGFIARQNYMCCQNCGWHAIYDEYKVNDESNVVFYHNQDNDSFNKKGELTHTLFLAWQGNGEKIKSVIENHGYKVEWDGTENQRIGIVPNTKAI